MQPTTEAIAIDGHTLLAASIFLPLEEQGLELGLASIARRLNRRYSRDWSAAQWRCALASVLQPNAAAHLRV